MNLVTFFFFRNNLLGQTIDKEKSRGKIFRFEVAWQLKEDCSQVISNAWLQHTDNIQAKLLNYKKALLKLRKTINHQEKSVKWAYM